MQRQAYDQLFKVEDTHWYHDARRKLVEIYIKHIKDEVGHGLKILDVGSGTGGMFNLLEKYGDVTGLELSEYAAGLSLKKYLGISLKIGSANNLSELFPESSFDLVTFFNVLYHQWITDDKKVLKQTFNLIRREGYILLVEPAFKCLYRDNDKFCYGIRRYSLGGVSALLAACGFSVQKETYFNAVSFLPLLASAMLQRSGMIGHKDVSDELKPLPTLLNGCLKATMFLERTWIIAFGKMPFGVSFLAVGKKSQ